jgi:hypothetical protein
LILPSNVEIHWLDVEVVAADGERLFAGAGRRMRRERDDRNIARFRVAFEPTRRLPAVDPRHHHVQQHEVAVLAVE